MQPGQALGWLKEHQCGVWDSPWGGSPVWGELPLATRSKKCWYVRSDGEGVGERKGGLGALCALGAFALHLLLARAGPLPRDLLLPSLPSLSCVICLLETARGFSAAAC